MSRLARKYKKNRCASGTPRPNPPFWSDMTSQIAPAFAGFVASRLSTRMLTIMVSKRWPKFAPHAGALSSVVTFAAAWWGAHKIKALAKYHDGIVVGAGIGAAATLLQTYVPKLGWMVQEVGAGELAAPAPGGQLASGEYTDPGEEWGTYNEAFDPGRYTSNVGAVPQASTVPAQVTPAEASAIQSLENLDDVMGDSLGSLSFGGN